MTLRDWTDLRYMDEGPMTDPQPCAERVAKGKPPSDVCLQRATRHICHDLYLMQLAWEKRRDRVGYTMWFITVRGLMDCFFPKGNGRNKDDIHAADYHPNGTWAKTSDGLLEDKPADYCEVRSAANKLAAHLTYSRVDQEEASIPPSAAVHAFILRTAARWIEEMSSDRREWITEGIVELLATPTELKRLLDEGRGT